MGGRTGKRWVAAWGAALMTLVGGGVAQAAPVDVAGTWSGQFALHRAIDESSVHDNLGYHFKTTEDWVIKLGPPQPLPGGTIGAVYDATISGAMTFTYRETSYGDTTRTYTGSYGGEGRVRVRINDTGGEGQIGSEFRVYVEPIPGEGLQGSQTDTDTAFDNNHSRPFVPVTSAGLRPGATPVHFDAESCVGCAYPGDDAPASRYAGVGSDHDRDMGFDTTQLVYSPPTVDLGVTVRANDAAMEAGSTETFTVAITNTGPTTARGVQATIRLPEDVTPIGNKPSLGTCTNGQTMTCTIGDVPEAVTVAIDVGVVARAPGAARRETLPLISATSWKPKKSGPAGVEATATTTTTDRNSANNTATAAATTTATTGSLFDPEVGANGKPTGKAAAQRKNYWFSHKGQRKLWWRLLTIGRLSNPSRFRVAAETFHRVPKMDIGGHWPELWASVEYRVRIYGDLFSDPQTVFAKGTGYGRQKGGTVVNPSWLIQSRRIRFRYHRFLTSENTFELASSATYRLEVRVRWYRNRTFIRDEIGDSGWVFVDSMQATSALESL